MNLLPAEDMATSTSYPCSSLAFISLPRIDGRCVQIHNLGLGRRHIAAPPRSFPTARARGDVRLATGTATWRRVSRAAGTQPEHRRIRRSIIAGFAFVIAVLTSAANGRAADKVKAALDPAVLEAVGQCAQHSAVTLFMHPIPSSGTHTNTATT